MFGGIASQWMDEVAYIAATRFTRMKMVTVSAEKVQFLKTVLSGTIAEIVAKIINIKRFKLYIQVEIFIEEMDSENRYKAANAFFTFAAIDDNNKPLELNI